MKKVNPMVWSRDEMEAWCAARENPVLVAVPSGPVSDTVRGRLENTGHFELTLEFSYLGCANLARLLSAPDGLFEQHVSVFLAPSIDGGSFPQDAAGIVRYSDSSCRFAELLQMFCNSNSLHFLDYSALDYPPDFEGLIDRYISWLNSAGIPSDHCCVDSSGVLAAYGIRPARDLDFIHKDGHRETGMKEIGCHNKLIEELRQTSGFNYSCGDLVTNPDLYFYYRGLKFASLPLTREMKAKRLMFGVRSRKDDLDVQLIDRYLAAVEAGKTVSCRGLALRRWLAVLLDFRYNQQLLLNAWRRITGRKKR